MENMDPGHHLIHETYVTCETLDAELEHWMQAVAPYQWRTPDPLLRDQAALLVVDMTQPFVDDASRPLYTANARAILPRVANLADAFRSAGRPVLWIVQGHHSVEHDRGPRLSAWWPTPLIEGTNDVQMANGLSVAPGEKIIVKRRYSGFHQTDLECTLRCLAVTHTVVCGVFTHVCPMLTAFDAFMRDFAVYYVADATASLNRSLHLSALQSVAGWCGRVVRAREVVERLAST